jgi:hypothetical protein
VAKRNPGRRGSSRKRRPNPGQPRERARTPAPVVHASQRQVGLFTDVKAVGERPPPPWHPLPLAELLIFVGIVGAIVGWVRGYQSNAPLIGAAIGAVVIGTVEVSLREHLSGFRPHTGQLAAIPAVVFHTAVILVVLALAGHAPSWLYYGLLPIDLALVALCFKLLRGRYVDARRARTATAGR